MLCDALLPVSALTRLDHLPQVPDIDEIYYN